MTAQTIVSELVAAGVTSISIADVLALTVVLKEEHKTAAAEPFKGWKDASIDQLLGIEEVHSGTDRNRW